MLNQLGNYAMTIGTVVALIGGARIPPVWELFWLGFIILMIGVVLKQKGKTRLAHELIGGKVQDIRDRLKAVTDETVKTNADKSNLNVRELHQRVNHITSHLIYQFARGLPTIKTSLGLPAYNDIMTSFAPGERYLNRVWSATTDGYLEEAHDYLEMAVPQIQEAYSKFESHIQNS